MISVIIPTYNRLSSLDSCIDSIIRQSYKDIEIIVVDDGSTDGTRDIYQNDHRVRYFYKKNGGVSSARNFGIKIAKGEYIAFNDSDDTWEPNKLEVQIKYLKKNDFDAVLCEARIINTGDGKINYTNRKYTIVKNGYILDQILKKPFLMPPTVLCKREVFDIIGYFNENLKTAEDVEMFLRMASKCRIGLVADVLVNIHKNNRDSISSNEESYINHIYVMENFFKNEIEYNYLRNEIVSEIYFEYSKYLSWTHKYLEADQKIQICMKLYPTAKYRIFKWKNKLYGKMFNIKK